MVENRWALLLPAQGWWSGPRWINFHPQPSIVTKYAVCAHQFSTQKWPKTLQNALHQTYTSEGSRGFPIAFQWLPPDRNERLDMYDSVFIHEQVGNLMVWAVHTNLVKKNSPKTHKMHCTKLTSEGCLYDTNCFLMVSTDQKWKTGHVWFSFHPQQSMEPNGMGCTYQFSAKKRRPKRPFLTKSPLYETNLWRLRMLENSFRTGVALQVWGTGSSWIEFHPCPKKGTKRTVHSPPI